MSLEASASPLSYGFQASELLECLKISDRMMMSLDMQGSVCTVHRYYMSSIIIIRSLISNTSDAQVLLMEAMDHLDDMKAALLLTAGDIVVYL